MTLKISGYRGRFNLEQMHMSRNQRTWKTKIFIICLTLILASIFLGNINKVSNRLPFHSSCLFRTVTGIDCPACGVMRSIAAVMRLDLYRAWSYNPCGIAIFLIVILYVLYFIAGLCSKQRLSLNWKTELRFTEFCDRFLMVSLIIIWIYKLV